MRRANGTGSIYIRKYSSNASIFGGTSGKPRPVYDIHINGIRYKDLLYRIVAMYAIGDLFGQGPLFDLREVHHIDDDVNNWKPSNLIIAENRRQHRLLDLFCRAQKLSGKFVTIRPKGAVPIGDIITDDNFDIEIALTWYREMLKR
jgi:hypothetical protein